MKVSATLRLEPDNLISDVRNHPFALGAREDSQCSGNLDAELFSHAPAANLIYEQEFGVEFPGQDDCRGFAAVELCGQGGEGQIVHRCSPGNPDGTADVTAPVSLLTTDYDFVIDCCGDSCVPVELLQEVEALDARG